MFSYLIVPQGISKVLEDCAANRQKVKLQCSECLFICGGWETNVNDCFPTRLIVNAWARYRTNYFIFKRVLRRIQSRQCLGIGNIVSDQRSETRDCFTWFILSASARDCMPVPPVSFIDRTSILTHWRVPNDWLDSWMRDGLLLPDCSSTPRQASERVQARCYLRRDRVWSVFELSPVLESIVNTRRSSFSWLIFNASLRYWASIDHILFHWRSNFVNVCQACKRWDTREISESIDLLCWSSMHRLGIGFLPDSCALCIFNMMTDWETPKTSARESVEIGFCFTWSVFNASANPLALTLTHPSSHP